MPLKQTIGFCLIALFALAGCKKSGNNPKIVHGTDVYAVGYIVKNNIYYATCWKNGMATTLAKVYSEANSVAVSGNDVYVAGAIHAANNVWVAAYWKNGVVHKLADSLFASQAKSIAVDGNDVHIAGYEYYGTGYFQENAVYWKNGVATVLPNSANGAGATAIALNGNDVYVAGYVFVNNGAMGVYWKNGALTTLDAGTYSFTESYPTGIAVNTNNVFTAGYVFNGYGTAKVAYWTDRGLTTDYNHNVSSVGNAMALRGNDIYIAGDTLSSVGGISTANCWKNGVTVNLANGNVGSDAYAIAVSGNDVYIGGFYAAHKIANAPFLGKAVYWKNGETVQLSSDTSNVYGLAIAVH